MSVRDLLDNILNEKPSKVMKTFDETIKEKISDGLDTIRLDIISETFHDEDDEDLDEEIEELDELVAGKKRTASQRLAATREKKKKTAKKIKKNKKLKRIRKTAKFKTQLKKREKLNVGKKARTARRREQEAKKRK